MTEPSLSRRPPSGSRPVRRLLLAAGVFACVLLVLMAALYLNRRAAARQALTGWLDRQGIQSDVRIERLELDSLIASVRIGDPRDPDVVVERVELDYVIGAPWSKAGLGLSPSRIRLVRPVARATWRDGELSFGSLDPLIERFTGQPPRPDSRGPLVLVEDATLRLQSGYGAALIRGDARVDDGKLVRLVARMPATNLRSGDGSARALSANLDLTTTGDRVAARGAASAGAIQWPGLGGQNLRLTFAADLPYPDLKTRKGDGLVRLTAIILGERLSFGGATLRDGVANARFEGRTAGWIETFRIDGTTEAKTRAGAVGGNGFDASGLTARLTGTRTLIARDADGLSWRLDGGTRIGATRVTGAGLSGSDVVLASNRLTVGGRGAAVEAAGPVGATARRLMWNALSLSDARSVLDLDLVVDGGIRMGATGSLRAARGAWPLFGPAARDDLPELVEMKRALGAFAVDAPAFAVVAGDGGTRVTLTRPATLRPANGGVLTLRPAAGPIFAAARGQAGGGALSLTATRGRGLPEAAFAIADWRVTPDGFTAALDGRAALDFGLARGIALDTRGWLTSSRAGVRYIGARCVSLTVARLELGENDVTALSGEFCPVERPLVSIADGRWRADGTLRGVDATAPFLALRVRDTSGALTATGGPGGIGLDARIATAMVEDATRPLRFNPVTANGTARLAGENWSGSFDLARNGAGLGRLDLAHDGRTGTGGITIDAPSVVFADGGLQPADLSPLAGDVVGSPATGSVAFQGRVDWAAESEGSSSGRLTIPGLDFVSAAGPVKGLRGAIDFTSLAPLITDPDQRLTADRLETFAPLTDVAVTFGLDKAGVTVGGGTVALAGGTVRVEPFTLPLDRSQSFSGVIVLDKVQLGEVIAGSGFGDNVILDAVVSGHLPFTSDPERGIRIAAGSLQAIQPGRLSIAREALSGLEAGGGGDGLPPNTVQDLAYQAMEDLSFDILSAEVNSLDEGRIGVLFRIRGRHDPPERQELRASIAELISREFLNRPLTLPSGTGIDLTLDTSLNVNQLVGDLLRLNRARKGQPSPETTP
ncbi:YdbH domain-containing protein [Brevundimonas sp.]|uniref:intermembrane phospholipid transport protein YdbH family protein n=1 Tax=Brevundimonas sp. TaxID=1871086 RepID=UPI00356A8D4B